MVSRWYVAVAGGLALCRLASGEFSAPSVTLRSQLGRPGVAMPLLALGTGGFDNADASAAVTTALSKGFTHVHAAYDYFNLPGVAVGLASVARSSVFVTGMTSPCVHTAAPPKRNISDLGACYDLTLRELHATLEALRLDYLDLVLVHGPSEPFGFEGGCSESINRINLAQWRAYSDFLTLNKTRAIGVSNYCQSCLQGLSSHGLPAPAVNQIQWHVGMGADPGRLPSYCAANGIVVQAYGPLAGGQVVTNPLVKHTAEKYEGKSAAQVGLRWVAQRPSHPALVTKASNPAYLEEDLETFSWSLNPEDAAALTAATQPRGQQGGRPSWGCSE